MSLPETMRALRKNEPGPGAVLEEVPTPVPGPDEVLVKVTAASICGTDLHIYNWDAWAEHHIRPPLTFGHEVAGEVVATGDRVETVSVGDFVSAETHLFCGHCALCRRGKFHICENLRILGVDTDGAFADFVAIPAVNAWPVAPGIAHDVASIQEPFGNAVHTILGPDGGDVATSNVVVVGCGPIGLFAVGICRAIGARQVVAIDVNEFRLGLAKQMGADLLLDPSQADAVAAVMEATDGHGAEVVLEMSGAPAGIESGTRMLAHGGRMSLLGLPTEKVAIDVADQVIFKEARLFGIVGRELFRTWEQTSVLLGTGMVDVTPVITHRFPLDRFTEAFEMVASGRSGKVILLP